MAEEKKQSLTVFKTDRHEDIAAIILAGIVVLCVLMYMSFVTSSVVVHAGTSGLVTKILVAEQAVVKKGDPLYELEITEKVWKGDVAEEVKQTKTYKAVTNGVVVEVLAKAGDKVKKHSTPILELAHEKGTLP